MGGQKGKVAARHTYLKSVYITGFIINIESLEMARIAAKFV